MSGSQGSGKRPVYEDLDALEAMDPIQQVGSVSHTDSTPSSSSKGKKKRKNLSAHEKDEGYPPKEYTQFIREVTINYYRIRSRDMLKRAFLDHGQSGVMALQADLEREYWNKLRDSELFMDCMVKYHNSPKWMAQQVITSTTNITHVFECVVKKPRGEDFSDEDKLFLEKLKWVQSICAKFSSNRSRTMPWNEQALKAAMEQHMNSSVVWIPEKAEVVPLSGFTAEGGYGKVRKVCIANMKGIPIHIEFAGKLSKAQSEREKREQRSIEALVCPVQHPGVIKFWGIHTNTMEAYTLWWNGDCLRNFLRKINSKASEAASYTEVLKLQHLTIEECERIVAFRRNRAMLAWALIYIMDLVHKAKVIHNDLTPSNILLHFPPQQVHNVYIGVCDWGMASRIVENKPSYFGHQNELDLLQHKDRKPGMAPELFYVYGPPNDEEHNLEHMKREHPYTPTSDAFSVGYLEKMIWKNEECKELFKDTTNFIGFSLKLESLVDPDPTKRPSLAKVVLDLMSPPYNFKIPDCCFRNTI